MIRDADDDPAYPAEPSDPGADQAPAGATTGAGTADAGSGPGSEAEAEAGGAKLARIYSWLADVEFRDYSPLYEHLARHIAADPTIPAMISSHNQTPFAAVLSFACIRWLTLEDPTLELAARYEEIVDGGDPLDPDPWPLVRDLIVSHGAELGHLLETRSIQTNEVGRSSALLPAFGLVAERFHRPLALIEVGCSAGLNLFFDRFHVDYGEAGSAGPVDSTVKLVCEVIGPDRVPIPRTAPVVASRLGIDLNPVDVTDDDAVRWLEACVWPDVPHRVERLRAAVAMARREPPELWAGDAVDLVTAAIEQVPDDHVACLDSTWVLAYVSADGRERLHHELDRLGADRTIAYVTAEYPGNGAPWLGAPPRLCVSTDHAAPTLLGLGLWDHGVTEHRALGWLHPHGRWLDWMAPSTPG